MYKKTLLLDHSDPITLEWGENYANLTIKMGEVLIGSVKDKAELKLARRFILPDQRQIIVVYTEFGLELWYNGVELFSKSKSGSTDSFSNAVKTLLWFGVFQLLVVPVMYFVMEGEERVLALWDRALIGGLLLGLGFWAKIAGKKTPFIIGIGFAALNIILTLAAGSAAGILVSGILIYYLVLGVKGDAPMKVAKQNLDPNAPLDSNL